MTSAGNSADEEFKRSQNPHQQQSNGVNLRKILSVANCKRYRFSFPDWNSCFVSVNKLDGITTTPITLLITYCEVSFYEH